VSCSPGEVEDSDSKRSEKTMEKTRPVAAVSKENPRPPLVRTSRGRAQVLPSRFNDSILDDWKKDKSSKTSVRDSDFDYDNDDDDDDDDDADAGVRNNDKFGFKTQKYRVSGNSGKIRGNVGKFDDHTYEGSSSSDGEEYGNGYDDDDEDYEEHVGRKDRKGRNVRRYSGSRSTLTSLRERHWVEDMKPPVGLHSSIHGMLKENHHMVNGSCDSEEFVPGDIVWAKSGKNDPAWPAIVINPSSQAPRQVLEFRVPKAVCVMFFGYSGNGRQRVSMIHLVT